MIVQSETIEFMGGPFDGAVVTLTPEVVTPWPVPDRINVPSYVGGFHGVMYVRREGEPDKFDYEGANGR